LEGKCLGHQKNTNSIGFSRKNSIQIDGEENKFGNFGNEFGFLDESDLFDEDMIQFAEYINDVGFFMEGDFVGLGLIRQPNSKLECFATCNGEFLCKNNL